MKEITETIYRETAQAAGHKMSSIIVRDILDRVEVLYGFQDKYFFYHQSGNKYYRMVM